MFPLMNLNFKWQRKFSTVLTLCLTSTRNEKAQFKVALRRYLILLFFYSVDKYHCVWSHYIELVLHYFCLFSIFSTFCMLMTYATSCCHLGKLWIHGMYVCMYACMYVCMYVWMNNVYLYACVYICIYVCTYVCMNECMIPQIDSMN
jgi:hypothetical protein